MSVSVNDDKLGAFDAGKVTVDGLRYWGATGNYTSRTKNGEIEDSSS